MPAENIGSIFTVVGVNLQQFIKGAKTAGISAKQLGVSVKASGMLFQELATRAKAAGIPLRNLHVQSQLTAKGFKITGVSVMRFGNALATTIGIALRWYVAYRAIRAVLGTIGKAFADIKALEIEGIFTKPALASEDFANILEKISPLVKKWGIDVVHTYRAVIQFARALGDMYEMDLPQALALTNVAMKTTVVTGQNLNESISNMVGFIRILGLESVKDIDRFMAVLYAAAYRTNEALAEAGKRVQGGALAMDSLTDAIQRMLPSMVDFGFTWEQMAAIASVFITNLDEAGQGIGAYATKLWEAMKDNQALLDIYKAVNIELKRGPQLLSQMTAGYLKMSPAQRDVASSATSIGIGAHIVAAAWKGLLQMEQRAIDVGENHHLLNIKAAEMMMTLQKKQDQLRASIQLTGITIMQEQLPALKLMVDYGKDVIDTFEWLNTAVLGGSLVAIRDFHREMLRLRDEAEKEGFWGQMKFFAAPLKAAAKASKGFLQGEEGAWKEYVDRILKIDQKRVEEYGNIQLKLRAIHKAAMQEMTIGEALILEDIGKAIKNFGRDINIAAYRLGPYASKVEIAREKLEALEEQLKELEELGKGEFPSITALRQYEEAIAKTTYQIEKQKKIIQGYSQELFQSYKYRLMEVRGIKEVYIIEEKLRDLEKERNRLKEQGLKYGEVQLEINDLILEKNLAIERKVSDISNRLKDIGITGLMGVIDGTKTWRNILEDIGEYTIQEIIRGLIEASLIGETLRGGGKLIWDILGGISSLGSLFGGTTTRPSAIKTGYRVAHLGGEISKIPRFQFGGEVPIMAKPGEYVVREGPAQRYKGLLEKINAGRDIEGKTEHYYMFFPHDMRTFAEYLMQNKEVVHALTRDAQRHHKIGFRGGE